MSPATKATSSGSSRRLSPEQAEALAEKDARAQERLKRDVVEASDELLDEIDTVLEEAAVAAKFVQKGGE